MQNVDEQNTSDSNSIKLARVLRLQRIYRLIRIVRLVKLLRVFKFNQMSFPFLKRLLNISVQTKNLLKVLGLMMFITHLMACFWFLEAKL